VTFQDVGDTVLDAKIEDAICRVLQRLDRYGPPPDEFAAPREYASAEAPSSTRWGAPWSEAEDAKLKQLWGSASARVIGTSLFRSRSAVWARARILGLTEGRHAA
jgi:hypothetical protein